MVACSSKSGGVVVLNVSFLARSKCRESVVSSAFFARSEIYRRTKKRFDENFAVLAPNDEKTSSHSHSLSPPPIIDERVHPVHRCVVLNRRTKFCFDENRELF